MKTGGFDDSGTCVKCGAKTSWFTNFLCAKCGGGIDLHGWLEVLANRLKKKKK